MVKLFRWQWKWRCCKQTNKNKLRTFALDGLFGFWSEIFILYFVHWTLYIVFWREYNFPSFFSSKIFFLFPFSNVVFFFRWRIFFCCVLYCRRFQQHIQFVYRRIETYALHTQFTNNIFDKLASTDELRTCVCASEWQRYEHWIMVNEAKNQWRRCQRRWCQREEEWTK